jgi:hypothetical protein
VSQAVHCSAALGVSSGVSQQYRGVQRGKIELKHLKLAPGTKVTCTPKSRTMGYTVQVGQVDANNRGKFLTSKGTLSTVIEFARPAGFPQTDYKSHVFFETSDGKSISFKELCSQNVGEKMADTMKNNLEIANITNCDELFQLARS